MNYEQLQIGTKVTYDLFINITFEGTDENHVILKDKNGTEKRVYKSLFEKYGKLA